MTDQSSTPTDTGEILDEPIGETCDECETNGYNCPLHDGPEWEEAE